MNTYHCYIVVNGSYPVEAFLEKKAAIECVRRWTGEYPSPHVYIFRCPLSADKQMNLSPSRESDQSQQDLPGISSEQQSEQKVSMIFECPNYPEDTTQLDQSINQEQIQNSKI